MKLTTMAVELLSITPNSLQLIERAGRVCYKSEHKINNSCDLDGVQTSSAETFVRKLVHTLHHESVIEHASATLWIRCDRGISHEIVRHRIASYSQESTRYVKYDGGMEVIPPLGLNEADMTKFVACMEVVESTYKDLRDSALQAQVCRDVLPTCLKTEIVMTANFREWRHFISLRGSKAAHPKIRVIAMEVLKILSKECPVVFEDLVVPV